MNTSSFSENPTKILELMLISREIDLLEESELYPRRVPYQFSAKGHELSQVLLGSHLNHPRDGICTYYRGRALSLCLGVSVEQLFKASLAKQDSFSAGRDIGVIANRRSTGGATILPAAGDVGAQYTPACGWGESIKYYENVIGDPSYKNAISVAHGGDGSVASNGFWAALNIATTRSLPMIFFIEDNGFAISVPSDRQVPGGNIAKNLSSYGNLELIDADGTEFQQAAPAIEKAVAYARNQRRPVLIRLSVCRLSGHSGQDSQSYKSEQTKIEEKLKDPIVKMKNYLGLSDLDFEALREKVRQKVIDGLALANSSSEPVADTLSQHLFAENSTTDSAASKHSIETVANSSNRRVNMVDAIRETLAIEMETNSRMLLLGEDIGTKGGVHTATMGLREAFGNQRVIDTSLSEEGIIGTSVGLALSGLRPVPEIQFRKYADAATEQLVNCGTIRWRTNGSFSAPLVVRMPIGVSRKVGDPWHSVSGESIWAHQVGWQIAIPSNVADATGLLRTALRGGNPVFFFEHRALLDAESARGEYPGDSYTLPFGKGKIVNKGSKATIVAWGMMVERCVEAIARGKFDIELIDLRTIQPWDKELVFESLQETGRLLLVHEDNMTSGFGAEIAACVVQEAFYLLDAPVMRLAVEDTPIPYNQVLTSVAVPGVDSIVEKIELLLSM